jgi:hypothetical protein
MSLLFVDFPVPLATFRTCRGIAAGHRPVEASAGRGHKGSTRSPRRTNPFLTPSMMEESELILTIGRLANSPVARTI